MVTSEMIARTMPVSSLDVDWTEFSELRVSLCATVT